VLVVVVVDNLILLVLVVLVEPVAAVTDWVMLEHRDLQILVVAVVVVGIRM
jgi:hypothetical protein